jgi:D-methionine transport system ATP-binding protein
MIELKNVSKNYRQSEKDFHALHDVSLTVPRGHIMGVIGESGSGKSSLIRCINLLEQPTSGEVWVNGQSLLTLSKAELREVRRSIGFISQECNLLSNRTVYDNIALPLYLSTYKPDRIHAIVTSLLTLTGLEAQAQLYPAQLSGGQKQRVNIARALVLKPRVLLCDEATSALDPNTTHSILKLIKKLQQEFALTIVLITHEIEIVRDLCDSVTLLSEGSVIEQADSVTFFTHPKTDLAKCFVKKALHYCLPEVLEKKVVPDKRNQTVLRISFCGHATHEPVISYLIKELGMQLNIIQAHIERVQSKSLGVMFVQTPDSGEKLQSCLDYLNQHQIPVEIIGYVD